MTYKPDANKNKARHTNQARQLAKHVPHLLTEVLVGNLTYPKAMLKLAEEKMDWQTPTTTTANDQVIKAFLTSLKDQFNNGQPPLATPKPFPKDLVLSQETQERIARQQAESEAKSENLDRLYKTALRPDPINRSGHFNRNLNIERR